MGYRDNLKNRALPHARLADFYTVKVVYFCSGEWCVFIPALTRKMMKNLFAAMMVSLVALPLATDAKADIIEAKVMASNHLEVVVIDPPVNFKVVAGKLGYVIGDSFILKTLSLKATRVRIPRGHLVDTAISELEKHFPDLIVGDGEV